MFELITICLLVTLRDHDKLYRLLDHKTSTRLSRSVEFFDGASRWLGFEELTWTVRVSVVQFISSVSAPTITSWLPTAELVNPAAPSPPEVGLRGLSA